MTVLLTTIGVAFVSAFIPVVNLEAYLVAQSAVVDANLWLIAAAAAFGQMVGKGIWYEFGMRMSSIPWFEKKLNSPKWQAKRLEWREKLQGRPVLSGGVILFSGAIGIPPFALIAILAGELRINRILFWTTGLAGRFVRFLFTVGVAEGIADWIH